MLKIYLLQTLLFLLSISGAGFLFTMALFNLPKNYQQGNKIQCFIWLTLIAAGFGFLVRYYTVYQ